MLERARTESASESSSWPSMLLERRQRAILPSSMSKIAPKKGSHNAYHMYFGSDVTR